MTVLRHTGSVYKELLFRIFWTAARLNDLPVYTGLLADFRQHKDKRVDPNVGDWLRTVEIRE